MVFLFDCLYFDKYRVFSQSDFYDAMLTDVTEPKRMDTVSSQGFAWGYIGSCVPFTIGLAFVLFASKLGISLQKAMTIAFVITAFGGF